jgi:hypothetical protein
MRIGSLPLLFLLLTLSPTAFASARAGGYSLELVDEAGNQLPTFQSAGRTYVLGAQGRRYQLRIRNHTGGRVEFVASVDGRDVLDGEPSRLEKRGYIVDPYGEVLIDGFRLSSDSVAAFRFSSVSDSYASKMGDARDVGVVGVAVFPELRRYQSRGCEKGISNGVGAGNLGAGASAALAGAGSLAAPTPAPAPTPAAPMTAPAPSAEAGRAKKAERPGLGTEFGEARESHVYETEFERASSSPAAMLTIRYDDRPGLIAMGVDLDPHPRRYEAQLRENANPFRRDPGYATPPPGWNN